MESTRREEIVDKLKQIIESIDIIYTRSEEYSQVDDLLETPWGMTILDACIMRLQIIGETIKSIDDKTQQSLLSNYPQVPWRKMIGLRNIISHEYANVDYDIIWTVICEHLTPLKETITKIITDLNENNE